MLAYLWGVVLVKTNISGSKITYTRVSHKTKIYKEIITKNSPNSMHDTNLYTQEAQQTSDK